MKKIALFLFCLCWTFHLKAQFVPHKTSLYVGYFHTMFGNKDFVNIDGFIAPSLLNNFQSSRGYSANIVHRKNDHIRLGIGFQQNRGYNWFLVDQTDYLGAYQKQYAITPTLSFTSKQATVGILNRIVFLGGIAPIIGISILHNPDPLFEVRPFGTPLFQTSRDFYWGVHAAAGAEVILTKELGFYAKYVVQANWTDPIAYNDKHFILRQIRMGVFLRLSYDKNFLYK